MKKYKVFLILTLLFTLAINVVYFYSTLYIIKEPNVDVVWTQSLLERKESIITEHNELHSGRKIIVSAGSSALYGIRSKDISESIGIPTYNLGSHAGLGINFIIEETKKVTKSGDIIIFPLEFTLFNQNDENTLLSLRYFQLYDREKLNNFNPINTYKILLQRDFFSSINLINSNIFKSSLVEKSSFYADESLNDHGDMTKNVGYRGFETQPIEIPKRLNETKALKSILAFSNWCKQNEINLYLSYSATQSLPEYTNEEYLNYFNFLSDFFQKNEIKVLEEPKEVLYNTELFFDTPYHLNEEGMTIRTDNLINKLKQIEEFTHK